MQNPQTLLPNYTQTTDSSGATIFYIKTPHSTKSLAIHSELPGDNYVVSFNTLDYTPGISSWDDTLLYSDSFPTLDDAVKAIN